MKSKKYKIVEYNITTDGDFMRELYPVPYELEEQLEKLYTLAIKGKKSGIKKLTNYILKYPKVPALKNYLSVLYNSLNRPDKSYEVNHWIVSEHPEYLFGKLNLATEYFYKEEYLKMPEILGEEMELKFLYPQRDTFHIAEVTGFLKIAILYFSAIGDLEQAETRLNILKDIDPDSEDLQTAQEHYDLALLKQSFLRKQAIQKDAINVNLKSTILTNIETPPEFRNKQIYLLYENDYSIDNKIVSDLLKLPRESLIDDLNKVLEDSITRYHYFIKKLENGQYEDKTYSFLTHALFLLAEINASESLENVLEVLSQEEEFIELYLDDILTEYIWLVLYKISSADLLACKKFMFAPGIYAYSKSEVAEMINQVALHEPSRREEAILWFRDVLRFYNDASLKDNIIDSTLIGMLVNCVLDFKGVELLPEIEMLYDKEIVDLDSCGDIEDVKDHFTNDKNNNLRREITSIFGIYEEISSWGSEPKTTGYNFDDSEFSDTQPVDTLPKIGRNDLCPCGSGKKYKKCCLNN